MTARFGLLPAVLAALFLSSMRAQAQDIGAVLAGTHLARGTKVGVLRLAPYVSSTSAREAGLIDTVKALGFETAVDSYVGHDMGEAQALASVVLSPHRGNLDAVFTPTDKIAIGAMRAFQEWLRARPIPPQIMVDFLVVTAQNVDDPAIRTRVIHHQN
jgi:ABC-type sugar transport system substrate-binding protein